MISPLVTGVSFSAFCWRRPRICCSRSWSRAVCFPRCPGSFGPCARAAWTQHRGQSNAFVRVLMETRILERDSAIWLTNAIGWHRQSSRRKFGSRIKICRLDLKSKTVRSVVRWCRGGALALQLCLPTFSGLQCKSSYAGQWCLVFSLCALALLWFLAARLDRPFI
jgi:hypothetical protein